MSNRNKTSSDQTNDKAVNADELEALDIGELNRRAEAYIDEKEKAREETENPGGINLKSILTIFICVIAVFTCVSVLMPEYMSEKQVKADLGRLLSDAHLSIQQHLQETSKLPVQIPDRALRMFVRYEVVNADSKFPEYILRTQHDGVFLEFNSVKDKG